MKTQRIFTALSENENLYWFFSDDNGVNWKPKRLTQFKGPDELKLI